MIITGGKHYNSHRAANLGVRLGIDSGVRRLIETPLVINGAEGSTILQFNGADASAAGWAEVRGQGTLALQAGTAPTYNVPAPWGPGTTPDAGPVFAGAAGGWFQDAGAALGNPGARDVTFEGLIQVGDGLASRAFAAKWSTFGWFLTSSTSGASYFYLYMSDGTDAVQINSPSGLIGTFVYFLGGFNFSEASANGAQLIANGTAGTGANPSAVGDGDNAGNLCIGSRSGGVRAAEWVGFLAMHTRADWHQEGAAGPAEWLAVHKSRFALLTGSRPLISIASPPATSLAAGGNVGPAYQERIVSGAQRLSYMGAGAPRFVQRVDGAGRTFTGALVEAGALCKTTQNENVGSWDTLWNATTPATSVTLPDGRTSTTATLAEDGTNGEHYAWCKPTAQITGANGTQYCFAVDVAPANRDWSCLTLWEASGAGVMRAFFNATTGAFGTVNASLTPYIVGRRGSWYRPGLRFTGTGAYAIRAIVSAAAADNSLSFQGLTQDSLRLWDPQFAAEDYPSSAILTAAAAVARAADTPHRYSGAGHFGQKEGSIHFKFLSPSFTPGRSHYLWTAYQSGLVATNYMTAFIDTSGFLNIATATPGGSSGSIQYASNLVNNLIHTCCLAWKDNKLSLRVDGVWGTTDTSFSPNPNLDTLDIGADNAATNQAGPVLVGDVFVYPTERSSRIIPPWGNG